MTARYGRSAFKPKRRRLSDRGVFCIPKPPRLACGWGELMTFSILLFVVFCPSFSRSFRLSRFALSLYLLSVFLFPLFVFFPFFFPHFFPFSPHFPSFFFPFVVFGG